jgi:hypothetical protein
MKPWFALKLQKNSRAECVCIPTGQTAEQQRFSEFLRTKRKPQKCSLIWLNAHRRRQIRQTGQKKKPDFAPGLSFLRRLCGRNPKQIREEKISYKVICEFCGSTPPNLLSADFDARRFSLLQRNLRKFFGNNYFASATM